MKETKTYFENEYSRVIKHKSGYFATCILHKKTGKFIDVGHQKKLKDAIQDCKDFYL